MIIAILIILSSNSTILNHHRWRSFFSRLPWICPEAPAIPRHVERHQRQLYQSYTETCPFAQRKREPFSTCIQYAWYHVQKSKIRVIQILIFWYKTWQIIAILYQQHKIRERNRSFLRFRFGNKHPQYNSLSHSVAATFSRFWRGSQSSVNGSMSFRARRGCFGHLGKWSCVRPRRPTRPCRPRGFSWQVLSNVVGDDGEFPKSTKKQDRIHEPECSNASYVKTAKQLLSATLLLATLATLATLAILLSDTLAALRSAFLASLLSATLASYTSYSTLLLATLRYSTLSYSSYSSYSTPSYSSYSTLRYS